MDQGTRKTLRNMSVYFQNILTDEKKLSRDLIFSKRHTDVEYFNIASILMQRENAQYVQSLENWQKYKADAVPQKLQRPVAVFIPAIHDNAITLDAYRVFDIEQIILTEQEKIDFLADNRSHLYRVMKEVTIQKIINLCGDKNNWRNELITEYLNTFTFFQKADIQIKNLYSSCLHFTFQEELDEKDVEIKLCKEIEKNEYRRIYKNIHEALSGFHFFFIDFIKTYAVYEKEKKERMKLEMDQNLNIKELMDRTRKIKKGEQIIYPDINSMEIHDTYEEERPQKLTADEENMADIVIDLP